MRQPFYQKNIVWGDTYSIDDASLASIILYDSFFVVEHPRVTMRKKIKTCQQHSPLSVRLIGFLLAVPLPLFRQTSRLSCGDGWDLSGQIFGHITSSHYRSDLLTYFNT